MTRRLAWVAALWVLAAPRPADAQISLRQLSIEELMQIDVTTATRRPEPIGTAAAAISVITGEDIRRAGVTTIADALRLADAVQVARFNNGSWTITPRGFNANPGNKLLVMIDGRTVYSPLFAGPFWNTLDYVLDDLERIEVIRGPGASLWGANAVNGVVNIVTRHSRDTQGTLVSVASGNEDPAIAHIRHGGAMAGGATWRVYGKAAARGAQRFAAGGSSGDEIRHGVAGFRLDAGDGAASWMLTGDAFHSANDFPDRPAGEFTTLALQGGWSRALPARGRIEVQSYYKREYRRVPRQLTHSIDTVDLEAQHFLTAPRHAVVWGGGGRLNWDRTDSAAALGFNPASRTYGLLHAFVQDEIPVVADRFYVLGGAKIEWNAFSGAELQPTVRARLLLPRGQVLWGAVSRAVRRPTRFEDDVEVRGANDVVTIRGSDDFVAESLVATEAGYRIRPIPGLSVDATLFVHDYTDLRSQDLPLTGLPVVVGNTLEGHSRGVELALNVQPATWWRTHVSYTRLDSSIARAPGSRDVGGGTTELNDPDHLLGLRTSIDLPGRVELDAMLRSIGALPNPPVPAYTELNLRVGWAVTARTDLWVAGHDLLHDAHPEFGPSGPQRIEFERSVRTGATFRF